MNSIQLYFVGLDNINRLNHLGEPASIESKEEENEDIEQSTFRPNESRSARSNRAATPTHDVEQNSVTSAVSTESVASSDPAGQVVHNILSRSMDDFMKTYRHRGSRTAKSNGKRKGAASAEAKRSRSTSPVMQSDDDDSHTSSAVNRNSGGRSTSKSPNRLRLRTGALLTSLRDSQNITGGERFKRYMQMTESQSLARSMSPNGTVGAVDVSAVRWEYDNVQLKPIWKVPNTYQSPGRARTNSQGNSQSNSRAGSISPGARTTTSLIERLAQHDRYVATHGTAVAIAGESAGPTAVSFSFTAREKGTAVPVVQTSSSCFDNNDCISVASSVSTKTATTTASTTTSSAKH